MVTEPAGGVSTDAPAFAGWRFARRPFWLVSHLFAASVVVLFLALGFWQLDRLDQRRQANEVIERRTAETLTLSSAPAGDELDHRSVVVAATFLEADFVRIANRSQGGSAGEHVVGIVELDDGSLLAVNRGFVPVNAEVELAPVPLGRVELVGWLRDSVTRGSFGAVDDGSGTVLPRLDTEQVANRLGRPMASVWLQLAPDGRSGPASFPDPIPLPAVDEGPHLSYALQWFVFASLGTAFYVALLWRQSKAAPRGG